MRPPTLVPMTIPSLHALRGALGRSLAAGARVERRLCEGIVDPVFIVEPAQSTGVRVPELLDSVREATGLCSVFVPSGSLDELFYPRQSERPNEEWWARLLARLRESKRIDARAAAHSAPRRKDLCALLLGPGRPAHHPVVRMAQRFGAAPSVDELQAAHDRGELEDDIAAERWLLTWEQYRFADVAMKSATTWHLSGSGHLEPLEGHLVLLALGGAWQVFAHMGGWWGMQVRPSEKIAAVRGWQQRHGAEILSLTSTTLLLRVRRRPRDLDEAFGLAIEHDHFARDTLGLTGISLRDHARALCLSDTWFFHDRP